MNPGATYRSAASTSCFPLSAIEPILTIRPFSIAYVPGSDSATKAIAIAGS